MSGPSPLLNSLALAGYVLLLAGVGIAFSRLSRNTTDYFRNGSKTSWWVAGASVFMNSFSAFTFTGAAGVAFLAGWSAAASFLGGGLALLVCGLFLGRWFRQMRVTTFPEALSLRFGERTRLGFAAVTVVTQTVYASLFLYSLAIFASVVFGFPLGLTIIGLGLVVTIYTTIGGCWGATAGDFIQSVILIPVTTLLAVLCISQLGGVSGFFGALTEAGLASEYALFKSAGAFPGGAYGIAWAVAAMFQTFITGTSLLTGVRFFAVKDGREAARASYFAAGLLMLGVCIWFIPPMAGRLLLEQEILAQGLAHPPDAAYAITGLALLPPAISALLLIGMFSATVSSLDTGMNRNVAILVCDLYPAVCRRFGWRIRSSVEMLVPSRMLAFVAGLVIIGLASYMAGLKGMGILEIMIRVGAMLAIPMSVPLLLCLFVRTAPPWSALVAMAAGLLAGVLSSAAALSVQATTGVVALTTSGVFLLSAWLYRRRMAADFADRVETFMRRMKKPVNFTEEIGQNADRSQFLILAGALLALALLTSFLTLVSGEDWLLSLGIAGFYLAGAVLLAFLGRKRSSGSEMKAAPESSSVSELTLRS